MLSWQNRSHFFGIAARSMRQILVERARARRAVKRGGSRIRVTLDAGLLATQAPAIDLEALDEALTRLEALDAELARVVEYGFLAGCPSRRQRKRSDVSPATVKRRWTVAKAWLARELAVKGRK